MICAGLNSFTLTMVMTGPINGYRRKNMRKLYSLAAFFLMSLPWLAHGQNIQSGTIDGMQYQTIMPNGGCTAANPCGVVTYLGYQDASYQDATIALQNYFAKSGLHAIVIAPTINGSQDYNVNWGGYAAIQTSQQAQMVAVVKGVETQMGSAVDPANSVVTGGSLGGDGTQAALIACGPKGIDASCAGTFSAGVSFDAATYAAAGNATDIAALCGVPLMAVHGTADTNQNVSYDQNLAKTINGNPACNNSFNFVPVNGAGHGTWNGSSGYPAGTGAGTPLATIASDLAMNTPAAAQPAVSPAANVATTDATSTGTPAATTQTTDPSTTTTDPSTTTTTTDPSTASSSTTAAANTSTNQILPGGDSVQDCSGNTWAITAGGNVTENGVMVPGGGDTSALTMDGSCTVYGLSAGSRNDLKGWFTLSSTDPGNQVWSYMGATATPPTPTDNQQTATTTPNSPATPSTTPAVPAQTVTNTNLSYTSACNGTTSYAASTGGFGTINGQIYSPNGLPWVARGIDVHDWDMMNSASTANQIMQLFPGINMIRVAIESLGDNPQQFAAAVQALTSKGVVVEFSDYTNTTGQNVGGDAGSVYTGSTLAAENAMYAAFATAFKDNPYVWFGTNNEPSSSGGSLSDWQAATYNAIRSAGNNNPILIDPSGSRPNGFGGTPEGSGMTPATYANMTNIIWDPHVYAYQDNYATDSATANKLVQATIQGMQQIKSADGTVPVIIGEYGPQNSAGDAADKATITAVQNSQNLGGSGASGWAYTSSQSYTMVAGGSLTSWGQMVANFTKDSGNTGCAQSPIPDPVAGTNTPATDQTATAGSTTTPTTQAATPTLAAATAADLAATPPTTMANVTPSASLASAPITAPDLAPASTTITAPALNSSGSIAATAALATGH
jgi:hypothetical protein